MNLVDESFHTWTEIISQVIEMLISNPITASIFGMFVILIITNVISKVYDRNGEKKE